MEAILGLRLRALLFLLLSAIPAMAQSANFSPRDQQLYALARTDFKTFVREVTKDATSELGQAQAIVRWLAQNFQWRATDYQQRTVQEIIERKGGNCNELAMVARTAMAELNIKLRRVHEVHIYTFTPERGERAHQMVKEKGNTFSVFGKHHNDHIWLELYDSATNEWYPADPSSGMVGTDVWLKGRVCFGKRSSLNPITEDMIVPFAIFAADANGKFTISRTHHYLVDDFDRLYGGKLHQQEAWDDWVRQVDFLDSKVGGALAGSINLHDYEKEIDALAMTYDRLRAGLQKNAGIPKYPLRLSKYGALNV